MHLKQLLPWFLLVCLSITGCATPTGGNFEQGRTAFINQNYEFAFNNLLPQAQHGNPYAMYPVGYMYFYGKGTVTDPKAAECWFNKAAYYGDPAAISALQMIEDAKSAQLAGAPYTPRPYSGSI